MDTDPHDESAQRSIGTWHPALRPNTQEEADGNELPATTFYSHPYLSDEQAGPERTSLQVPPRPGSLSQDQTTNGPFTQDDLRSPQSTSNDAKDVIMDGMEDEQSLGTGDGLGHSGGDIADVGSMELDIAEQTQSVEDPAKNVKKVTQHHSSSVPIIGNGKSTPVPNASSLSSNEESKLERLWESEEKERPINQVVHISRTSSFPAVPTIRQTSPVLPLPLPPSHAESILASDKSTDNSYPSANSAIDKDARLAKGPFASTLDREDEAFFDNAGSGQGFFPTIETGEQSRYEEGLPLVRTSQSESMDPLRAEGSDWEDGESTGIDENSKFLDGGSTEQTKNPSTLNALPLGRKSTAKALDAVRFSPNEATRSDSAPSLERSSQTSVSRPDDVGLTDTSSGPPKSKQEMSDAELGSKDEDLAEMWKAALGDDDFLEDNEGPLDTSAFFGDDGEGFLEDDRSHIERLMQSRPISNTEPIEEPVSVQKIGGSDSIQSEFPNNYPAPMSSGPAQYPQSTMYAMTSPPSGPGTTGLGVSASQPSYSKQSVSRPQMPTSTQSFADKSKGGYTSPYDLPMDVSRPKKRNFHSQARPGPESQMVLSRPPPSRSSSMFTAPSAAESRPPVPRLPSAYLPPQVNNNNPSAPETSPSMNGFFEDLPQTKPRPSSSMGKYMAQPNQSEYTLQVSSQPGPPMQHLLPRSSSSNMVKGHQQYELLPPERLGLYDNAGQTAPVTKAIPSMSTKYSPAPTQSSTVLPPHKRYAASPNTAIRPPISQTLPFHPRTSSPLTQNHIVSETQQRRSGSDSLPQRLKSSSEQDLGPREPRNPSFPIHQPRAAPDIDSDEDIGALPDWRSSSPHTRGILQAVVETSLDSSYITSTAKPDQMISNDVPPYPRSAETPDVDFETSSRGPPRRSQTQSPTAARNLPPSFYSQVPYQRPASANHQTHKTHIEARSEAGTQSAPRRMAFSNDLPFLCPTDGRELDHLERWKGCPIFSFGFGGALVTSFPKQIPRYAAGQAIPMIKCSPGEVRLRDSRILPLEEGLASFPGPLRSKGKKKDVTDWLTKRILKLEDETAHFPGNTNFQSQRKCHEEKVLLWKIVRVMVEHDGALDGNPSAERAIRSTLCAESCQGDGAAASAQSSNSSFTGIAKPGGSSTLPDSTKLQAVEDLRKILLHGEREKAVWHAVDNHLWAHAMLLSSTLDQRIWKQVLREFVRQEVKNYGENAEALAALYQTFAGNFQESADELVPPSARAGLQMISKTATAGPMKNAIEGLDRWRETLTLILSNRTPEDSSALLSLGQLLADYGRIEAAHTCYIFAKSPGLFGGPDDPHVSIALLGAKQSHTSPELGHDIDSILLSEIYDFARTLPASSVATASPHLQPFKLCHAMLLADHGHRSEAQQYCDAIMNTLNATTKKSPYHHALLLEALNGLTERLRQAPRDNSGSWISKPSIDKVSGSIWAKFNQYVAGDETDAASVGSGKPHDTNLGPFSGVAGGSPTLSRTPSSNDLYDSYGPGIGVTAPLPHVNSSNPRYVPSGLYAPRSSLEQHGRPTQDSLRPGIHDSLRPAFSQQQYQSRPNSSAGEPYRPESTVSGYPLSTESYLPTPPLQSQNVPIVYSDTPAAPFYRDGTERSTLPTEPQNIPGADSSQDEPHSSPSHWPRSSFDYPNPSINDLPTSNHYEPPAMSSYDPPSFDPQTSPVQESLSEGESKKKPYMYDDGDDDEFEARAAKIRSEEKARKDQEADEAFRRAAEADAQKDKAPKLNAKKSGWFGGWLGGRKPENEDAHGTPNAPIKAKLGEQSSFYYDSEQKRWVNGKDPDATPVTKATPPPRGAPSRAGSASGQTSVPTSDVPPMPPLTAARATLPGVPNRPPNSMNSVTNSPSQEPLRGPSPVVNGSLRPALEAETLGGPRSPTSAPPSRPATSMSGASSIDDLIGAPQARKGGTLRKGKKKGYVDVMAK